MSEAAVLAVRRTQLMDDLRSEFEAHVVDRVSRYLEVEHQGIIANHHFAEASAQLLDLYRDGYFLSAVMVSQAVAEGIWKLLLKKATLAPAKDRTGLIAELVKATCISSETGEAFARVFRSERNDYHHMNPPVASHPTSVFARRNIHDIATIERDVFGFTIDEGRIIPTRPKNWDMNPDGTVPVYLRLG